MRYIVFAYVCDRDGCETTIKGDPRSPSRTALTLTACESGWFVGSTSGRHLCPEHRQDVRHTRSVAGPVPAHADPPAGPATTNLHGPASDGPAATTSRMSADASTSRAVELQPKEKP